jgi:hypothetical protein
MMPDNKNLCRIITAGSAHDDAPYLSVFVPDFIFLAFHRARAAFCNPLVCTNMHLHAEVPLVALFGLTLVRVALV